MHGVTQSASVMGIHFEPSYFLQFSMPGGSGQVKTLCGRFGSNAVVHMMSHAVLGNISLPSAGRIPVKLLLSRQSTDSAMSPNATGIDPVIVLPVIWMFLTAFQPLTLAGIEPVSFGLSET